MSSPKEKTRCYYDVLGIDDRKCDEDLIRSSYKKMALALHPDKAQQNGMTLEEATAAFKELQGAYSVLKSAEERKWYDDHRDQILRGYDMREGGDGDDYDGPDFLNLFAYFSQRCYSTSAFGDSSNSKNFFNVYKHVFSKVTQEDSEFDQKCSKTYPAFGDEETPFSEVSRFYAFWSCYNTKKNFAWKDEYNPSEMPDRQQRRAAERINTGARDSARKEYSRTVQQLAQHVRNLDPRVDAEEARLEKERKKRLKEQEKKLAESHQRSLEEKKEWLEEAAREAEENNMKSVAEETEVLEQLYEAGGGKKNKPKKMSKKQQQQEQQEYLAAQAAAAAGGMQVEGKEEGEQEGESSTSSASATAASGSPTFSSSSSSSSSLASPSSQPTRLRCDYCKKNFQTEKLYTEHCNSNKHKTQLKKLGVSLNNSSSSPTTTATPASSDPATATTTTMTTSTAEVVQDDKKEEVKKKEDQEEVRKEGDDNKSDDSEATTTTSSADSSPKKNNNKKKQEQQQQQQQNSQNKKKNNNNKNKKKQQESSSSSSSSSSSDDIDSDSSSSEEEQRMRPSPSASKFGNFQVGGGKKKKR